MTGRRPLVVVVTGSECTGKTTLARELADGLGAPCSAEFARDYLGAKAAPLVAGDVEPIARGQIEQEDAAAGAALGVVIKDTDLVSTVVYARHYYDSCPAWIEQAAAARLGDLYLLLHPDVPWVADGLFRDRPADRTLLHRLFAERLTNLGARTVDVTGDWRARQQTAFAAVAGLLALRRQTRA
jgi:NadR type nicotinamide-nucleotide adenylyltransferase